MSIVPILIGVAAKVGAPLVKGILEKHVGPLAGSVAETVIGTIAEKAGTTVDDLASRTDGQLEEAVTETEAETPELVSAWVEQQRLANELQTAEITKEASWTWAWRPAWMWLLGFLWTYSLVFRPLANAAFGASIESVDLPTLMTLTGAYLALYMGGNTLLRSRWGSK